MWSEKKKLSTAFPKQNILEKTDNVESNTYK